ncbi:MAG: hypothetical protein LBD30_01120 [Verrucomicrobiales bacterium]|jgi:hypothetical protein|nr:hypothetical protein [Verrucomicrobiales bacterium]
MNTELASVVARLEDFLAKYLADADRLGISISAGELAAAIDEAIHRCRDKSPSAPAGESVEAFFLDGISAALVEERQGVCEKQKNADGEEVYLAVSDEVWVQCLAALRESVGKLL